MAPVLGDCPGPRSSGHGCRRCQSSVLPSPGGMRGTDPVCPRLRSGSQAAAPRPLRTLRPAPQVRRDFQGARPGQEGSWGCHTARPAGAQSTGFPGLSVLAWAQNTASLPPVGKGALCGLLIDAGDPARHPHGAAPSPGWSERWVPGAAMCGSAGSQALSSQCAQSAGVGTPRDAGLGCRGGRCRDKCHVLRGGPLSPGLLLWL